MNVSAFVSFLSYKSDNAKHINALCTKSFILYKLRFTKSLTIVVSLLGLVGKELARQTSKPSSNLSWGDTVHPGCKTFNVMRAFKYHYIKCIVTGPITS